MSEEDLKEYMKKQNPKLYWFCYECLLARITNKIKKIITVMWEKLKNIFTKIWKG